jgi:hypothetical protein
VAPARATAREKPLDARPSAEKIAPPEGAATTRQGAVTPKNGAEKTADPAGWKANLEAAIAALERHASDAAHSPDEVRREAALRLLYLAADRREDALRPVAGVSPTQQEFWAKELFGLAMFLDADKIPDVATRAAQARTHLAEATLQLGELATLAVRNLNFCSEVKSFGVYQKFDSYVFRPGQELLLYAELENFESQVTGSGFHTRLRSSYQILDSRGQRVANHEFAVTEDTCRSRRRDFIMRYFIYLPKNMNDGAYTLQLTIEDLQSQKVGQAAAEFTIKGAGDAAGG